MAFTWWVSVFYEDWAGIMVTWCYRWLACRYFSLSISSSNECGHVDPGHCISTEEWRSTYRPDLLFYRASSLFTRLEHLWFSVRVLSVTWSLSNNCWICVPRIYSFCAACIYANRRWQCHFLCCTISAFYPFSLPGRRFLWVSGFSLPWDVGWWNDGLVGYRHSFWTSTWPKCRHQVYTDRGFYSECSPGSFWEFSWGCEVKR